MLLSRYLAVATTTLTLSAVAINIFQPAGQGQIRMGTPSDDPDENLVPGDNPLKYCGEPDEYLLDIDHVDLIPNPPTAGKVLSIEAEGDLREKVEVGAYVALQVKYGVITLIKQTVDLCEQVKNVELECPLEGRVKFVKDVELPREIPPGIYTVQADAYTVDDEPIVCLQAKVRFAR